MSEEQQDELREAARERVQKLWNEPDESIDPIDEVLPIDYLIHAPYPMVAALLARVLKMVGGKWRIAQTPGSITHTTRIGRETITVELRASTKDRTVFRLEARKPTSLDVDNVWSDVIDFIPSTLSMFVRYATENDEHLDDLLKAYPLVLPNLRNPPRLSNVVTHTRSPRPASDAPVDAWLDWREAEIAAGRAVSLAQLARLSKWSISAFKQRSAKRSKRGDAPEGGTQ